MASATTKFLGCSYVYIYIYIYVTKWQRSGFLEFTKLLLALSLFAQPFDRMRSIQKHYFIIPVQDVLEKKQLEKEEVL